MKRLFLLFAACAALMLVVSPAATYAQHDDPDMEWEMDGPLYDRMGGEEIVSGIVEEFVSMVIEDDKLKNHFSIDITPTRLIDLEYKEAQRYAPHLQGQFPLPLVYQPYAPPCFDH